MNLKEELLKYAEIDNDEYGEISRQLIYLSGNSPYLSEDFNNALESEMKRILQNYKDFSVIKTKREKEVFTVKYLEWK